MATAESNWCHGSFFDYQTDNGACKCSLDNCDNNARTPSSKHDIFQVEVRHDSRFWIVATDGVKPKIHGIATTRERSDEIFFDQKGSKYFFLRNYVLQQVGGPSLCVCVCVCKSSSYWQISLISITFLVLLLPEIQRSYVGCFRTQHNSELILPHRYLPTSSSVSIDACIKGCTDMGHPYAGLFNGGQVRYRYIYLSIV